MIDKLTIVFFNWIRRFMKISKIPTTCYEDEMLELQHSMNNFVGENVWIEDSKKGIMDHVSVNSSDEWYMKEIYKHDSIHIMEFTVPDGICLRHHSHKQKQWLFVLCGSIFVSIQNSTTALINAGGHICIAPNMVHSMKVYGDTLLISVFVPTTSMCPPTK